MPNTWITNDELSALTAARLALREIERRTFLGLDANDVEVEDDDFRPLISTRLLAVGRVAEAASVAEDAVFNVLNCAKHYGRQDIPDHVLHAYQDGPEPDGYRVGDGDRILPTH